jgi:hypothetical protein
LGVGLNNPTNTFEIASTSTSPFKVATTASYFRATFQNAGASGILDFNSSNFQFPTNSVDFGTSTALGARVGIRGSGSTSATTSLLVQNSAGTAAMTVRDDLASVFGGQIIGVGSGTFLTNSSNTFTHSISGGNSTLNYFNGLTMQNADQLLIKSAYNGNTRFLRTCLFGADSTNDASSQVQIDSTTKGFLPPRMTTTQKNAIASPAAGLVVYDSTTNKLCCYNGSTWNDLF